MFRTVRHSLYVTFTIASFIASLFCSGVIENVQAAPPNRLEIKSIDQVSWKDKKGNDNLLLNINPYQGQLQGVSPEQTSSTLLFTALYEGTKYLSRAENSKLDSLGVLLADIKDMNEYGIGDSGWSEIGFVTIHHEGGHAFLADVKFKKEGIPVPAETPKIPFPLAEFSTQWNAGEIHFSMPEKIYLVAGTKQQLFYENLVLLPDSDVLRFVPSGAAHNFAWQGRRSLNFSPTTTFVGEWPLEIKVTDWKHKIVVKGSTNVVVSATETPPIPGVSKSNPVRILIIGHCLPAMYWPAYFADYLSAPGNPPFSLVGSIKYWYGPYPDFKNKPALDTLYHEGAAGHTVNFLLNHYTDAESIDPNVPVRSPFIFKGDNDLPKIDMARYVNDSLGGKVPHFIVLNVGDNDTWGFDPEKSDPALEAAFVKNMNTFLDHLRSMAPKATIGVMMPNSYNYTERSFENNYGGLYPRWRQLQVRQYYIDTMHNLANQRGDVSLIPSHLVVDSVDGMPYNSGAHFNNVGARQYASAAYAWIKSQFIHLDVPAQNNISKARNRKYDADEESNIDIVGSWINDFFNK